MSFDPTTLISLIENCKKLYDYFSAVKQSSTERGRLLDEVRSLQSELESLQRLVDTTGNAEDAASMERLAQVLDPSQPFAKVVDDTLARVKDVLTFGASDPKASKFKVVGKKVAAALWWPVDKVEVKNVLLDLERYKTQIGLALQHDMFKKQDVMDGKLDNMEHHTSDEDRLKIAEFISKNDYTGDRKQLLEKKLSGTGTWMIHHQTFVAWRNNREPPKTLWCYGHPGAGKSVMAALIVEHLQSTPGNIVLSVFCRYSSNIFTTPSAVISGLLRQLIEKTTKVPRTLRDLYWRKTDPTPDTIPVFLAEIAAAHERPIYIVVDALDECPFGLDLLHALQHLDSSFRILVTSRPVFQEIHETPSIKIRASNHDILVAVDTTLSKLQRDWLDEKLKGTIRKKVVEKADGMFLLASLQLLELERVFRRSDVQVILNSLPRTLDDAYKLTFRRIRDQGVRSNDLACHILALVSLNVPRRGINIWHLLTEGDMSQLADMEIIIRCCLGLVHLDSMRIASFIHYSVHEYVTAHWSELFPEKPSRSRVCLELASSILRSTNDEFGMDLAVWRVMINMMRKPDELDEVVSGPVIILREVVAKVPTNFHQQDTKVSAGVPTKGTSTLKGQIKVPTK